jgi:hypothetical protein
MVAESFEQMLSPEQIAHYNSLAIIESGGARLSCVKGAWAYLHVNLIFNKCELIKGVVVKSNTGVPLDLNREEDSKIYNSIVRDARKQCMSHPYLIER